MFPCKSSVIQNSFGTRSRIQSGFCFYLVFNSSVTYNSKNSVIGDPMILHSRDLVAVQIDGDRLSLRNCDIFSDVPVNFSVSPFCAEAIASCKICPYLCRGAANASRQEYSYHSYAEKCDK